MENNRKYTIAIVFSIIILVMLFLVIFNINTLFQNKVILTYQDNCTEIYINSDLQGEICVRGRELADDYEKRNQIIEPEWNFTNPSNIT